jgi:hypothetical protein
MAGHARAETHAEPESLAPMTPTAGASPGAEDGARLAWLDELEHERVRALADVAAAPLTQSATAKRRCVACGTWYRACLDECPDCRSPAAL